MEADFTVIEEGNLRIHLSALLGAYSAADGGGWVSALFESLEAVRSWRDDFPAAEIEFKRINPSAPRCVPLGVRNPSKPNPPCP